MPKLQEENHWCYIDSPLGILFISEDEKGIDAIRFVNEKKEDRKEGNLYLDRCIKQLEEYFAGNRTVFDVPISMKGTPFQVEVWKALTKIPYGKTASYGKIAEMIGNPKAQRAVGMANNRNPIVIIVPCHRIIGKDGSLVGYGGGLDKKKFLLELERKHL